MNVGLAKMRNYRDRTDKELLRYCKLEKEWERERSRFEDQAFKISNLEQEAGVLEKARKRQKSEYTTLERELEKSNSKVADLEEEARKAEQKHMA